MSFNVALCQLLSGRKKNTLKTQDKTATHYLLSPVDTKETKMALSFVAPTPKLVVSEYRVWMSV